jgi:hypothetical protein
MLKRAVVSAIFLLPLPYSHSALSRNHSLSYQEAVWMCSNGSLQACDVMYAYDTARSGVAAGGSPADPTMPQDRTMSDNGDARGRCSHPEMDGDRSCRITVPR